MTATYGVLLHDVQLGKNVSALLTERVSGAYALRGHETWEDYRQAAMEAAREGEAYVEPKVLWNWSAIHKKFNRLLPHCLFGVECGDQVQGFMLTESDKHRCRLPDQDRKAIVYIQSVQTAPWNDIRLGGKRRYRGVGLVMLSAAIAQSRELGFKGRIGLHAIGSAESFYERHGLACLGVDADCNGYKYYEGSTAWADDFGR